MLFLYKTNDLNIVVNTICTHIKKNPLDNPLTSEIILVNSEEIKQWLNYSLSLKLGITANIKILHINSYIRKLYKCIIPKKKQLIEIKKDTILWYLLLLSKKKNIAIFLKKFKNSFEKYLFLSHIADLFKKYIKNRPDWINEWDKKKHFFKLKNQILQEKIWMFLIQHIKDTNDKLCFYPKLLRHYIRYINKKKIHILNFPNRVFLIGTVQSSIYDLLSVIKNKKFIDVYLFFFTVSNNQYTTHYQKKKKKIYLTKFLISLKTVIFLIKK
ncbi:exodeoxyribonuclease V subunit gamma [Buchnera aphidicola]|uniref:exodeoxyribonuclease V subunit gamma n=1 Tax=Buchnera aphidicola TaxID=9 RepID=UPI003463F1BF